MYTIEVDNVAKIFKVPKKEHKTRWNKLKHFLVKEYDRKTAVENISFKVKKGEFIGYIGPNGAGKSTTIKMLTGIITPTEGSVSVLGFDPHKERYSYSKHIGVVFGQRRLLEFDVAVMDSLKLYKAIYEISDEEFNKRIELYKKILNLDKYLHIPVRKLSLGERMRCEIAAALLHNPKIVFLDEPTIGLDQVAKEEIREFLQYINKKFETTIILTTHDMDDIEELCKRIILIDQGKKLFDGKLKQLKETFLQEKTVTATYRKIKDKKTLNNLKKQSYLQVKDNSNNELTAIVDTTRTTIPKVIDTLFKALEVDDLSVHEPRLEQVIREIYKSGKTHKEKKKQN